MISMEEASTNLNADSSLPKVEIVEPTSPSILQQQPQQHQLLHQQLQQAEKLPEVKQEREEGEEIDVCEEDIAEEEDEDSFSRGQMSPAPGSSSVMSPSADIKSDISSPSPLSSPATLPSPSVLFQPFLPAVTTSSSQHTPRAPNLPLTGALPFSIENILKPSFGQRLFLQSMAAAAAVAAHQQQQQQQQQRKAIHNSFNGLSGQISIKTESSAFSPPMRKEHQKLPKNNHNNNHINNSSGGGNGQQPVDLSSKTTTSSSSVSTASNSSSPEKKKEDGDVPPGMVRGPNGQLWPAWVFCTRYSDRPSSGPRSRKIKKSPSERISNPSSNSSAEKRPRTAFSSEQLARLKREFEENRYLTEERRKNLAEDLGLNENQIKIWFQNKRAKIKKSSGQKGELAQMLAAQGLYNHSTIPVDEDENPIF